MRLALIGAALSQITIQRLVNRSPDGDKMPGGLVRPSSFRSVRLVSRLVSKTDGSSGFDSLYSCWRLLQSRMAVRAREAADRDCHPGPIPGLFITPKGPRAPNFY